MRIQRLGARTSVVAGAAILLQISCLHAQSVPSPYDYAQRQDFIVLSQAIYFDVDDFNTTAVTARAMAVDHGWSLHGGIKEDPNTGLRYGLFIRDSDSQPVVVFTGTRTLQDWTTNFHDSGSLRFRNLVESTYRRVLTAINPQDASAHDTARRAQQTLGLTQSLQKQGALQAVLNIKHELQYNQQHPAYGKTLVVAGHSKAGGTSALIGAMTRTPFVGINPAPIGDRFFDRHLGADDVAWANSGGGQILSLTSDPVSALDQVTKIANTLSPLSVDVSRHIGVHERYAPLPEIEQQYQGLRDRLRLPLSKAIVQGFYLYESHSTAWLLHAVNAQHQTSRTRTIPSYSVASSRGQPTPAQYRNADTATVLARHGKRAVVFGYGPVAERTYHRMAQDMGHRNVRWIHSNPGPISRQVMARRYGADRIISIRHEAYREITNRGITQRIPIEQPRIEMPRRRIDGYADIKGMAPWGGRGPGPPGGFGRGGGGGGPPGGGMVTMPRIADIPRISNPSFSTPSFGVGGVMLRGSARVEGADGLAAGDFSLVFKNSNATMDVEEYRRFVTALWAVYLSREGPGISIDPLPEEFGRHSVRYIGAVLNTELGAVMREADYLMKKWVVGTERPDIPGFENPDDIAVRIKDHEQGWTRFWFVPQGMTFRKAGDALLFNDGWMTLQTEAIFSNTGRSNRANEEFAGAFTQSYAVAAERYPVFESLFEYAKLVSLARYLKDQGVPMLWFLLANKDLVITEDSTEMVEALNKQSDHYRNLEISGGVNLNTPVTPSSWVDDSGVSLAIDDAIRRPGPDRDGGMRGRAEVVTVASVPSGMSITPSRNLSVSSSTVAGDIYQTDLALRVDGEPQLELIRFFDPGSENVPTFGGNWHLMVPYRLTSVPGQARILRLQNMLTGDEEPLRWSTDRDGQQCFAPVNRNDSKVIGVFRQSGGGLKLIDKLGNQFLFDHAGTLKYMLLGRHYEMLFEHGLESIPPSAFREPPVRIEAIGSQRRIITSDLTVPATLRLIDTEAARAHVFSLRSARGSAPVQYSPVGRSGDYEAIVLTTDGGLVVERTDGSQIAISHDLQFAGLRTSVVQAIRQGEYRISFDYEYENDQFRIRRASVSKGATDETLHTVEYEYDAAGLLTRVRGPDGNWVDVAYDQDGVPLTSSAQ